MNQFGGRHSSALRPQRDLEQLHCHAALAPPLVGWGSVGGLALDRGRARDCVNIVTALSVVPPAWLCLLGALLFLKAIFSAPVLSSVQLTDPPAERRSRREASRRGLSTAAVCWFEHCASGRHFCSPCATVDARKHLCDAFVHRPKDLIARSDRRATAGGPGSCSARLRVRGPRGRRGKSWHRGSVHSAFPFRPHLLHRSRVQPFSALHAGHD